MEFILAVKPYAQLSLVVALVVLAWKTGAGPEKASALTLFCQAPADWLYHFAAGSGTIWYQIDIGHTIIDLVTTASFIIIAIHANRLYTIFLASLQIIALSSHIIMILSDEIAALSYSIISISPSYLQIVVLGVGIFLHLKRKSTCGPYPSWINL
ncbi:MAG: hypothetical protein H6918_06075 [Sphingomonadaceae bacterium]|nr:hypothetical protein [Sphingomonadaceae bacterium]